MKTKLALISMLLSAFPLWGDQPATSYMNELIQGAGDNLWWVYPKEVEGQTFTPPKGGYIYRFKVDMNGDGINEVFLLSSLDVTKDSESWTLYRRETSGSYLKLRENISLNGSLWAKTENGVKKYSFVTPPVAETGRESIISLWLDASGNFQTSTRELTEEESKAITGGDETLLGANGLPDDAKIAQKLQLGTSVAFTVEKVLLGKLYQNPNATWRAVNNDFTLSQQYLDPADAADIASLVPWQPPSQ